MPGDVENPRARGAGCLLGLALGDALGAPHEGDPIGSRPWWERSATGAETLRWTDDTQMALVLAEHLADGGEVRQDDLAREWAGACDPRRGYGMGALVLLRRVEGGEDWREARTSVFSDGSFGNGAAMRAAPLGVRWAGDRERRLRDTRAASEITHAHPLGIEGALLVTESVAALVEGGVAEPRDLLTRLETQERSSAFRDRLRTARKLLDGSPGPEEVVEGLGHGVVARDSVVTAIYSFLRHREESFLDLVAFAVSLGGDTDTIGAMAGALWGTDRGLESLPRELVGRLEARDRLEAAGRRAVPEGD